LRALVLELSIILEKRVMQEMSKFDSWNQAWTSSEDVTSPIDVLLLQKNGTYCMKSCTTCIGA
jgi:hypothetical protein